MTEPTCSNQEVLQKLLDGELDAESSELTYHHLQACRQCKEVLRSIEESRFFCIELLGLDDERETDRSDAAVRRVRSRLDHSLEGLPAAKTGRSRWKPFLALAASLVLALAGLVYFQGRKVVVADEILRYAEQATLRTRTMPGHIIRRIVSEKLVNSLGPLPDDDYVYEHWWDNAENRYAYRRFNSSSRLVEGNWVLTDGTTFVFTDYPDRSPSVVIGPTHVEVEAEIERLPEGERGAVREVFESRRRPLYQAAADLLRKMEVETSEALAGRQTGASAAIAIGPGGASGYQVHQVAQVANPESPITHWEISRFIEADSYNILTEHLRGYRKDGQVYEKVRELLEQEVFLPADGDHASFAPGPFPATSEIRHVSARERVDLLRRSLSQTGARVATENQER